MRDKTCDNCPMSDELDDLRQHDDHTDTSADIDVAQFVEPTGGMQMVGITIRLPAATLDAARAIARTEGVKVTAMLRECVEQRIAERMGDETVVPVSELRRLIARAARQPDIG